MTVVPVIGGPKSMKKRQCLFVDRFSVQPSPFCTCWPLNYVSQWGSLCTNSQNQIYRKSTNSPTHYMILYKENGITHICWIPNNFSNCWMTTKIHTCTIVLWLVPLGLEPTIWTGASCHSLYCCNMRSTRRITISEDACIFAETLYQGNIVHMYYVKVFCIKFLFSFCTKGTIIYKLLKN